MEILKYALIVIYIIVAAAIIILTLVQEKEDNGASGAITDTATNNFYDKNKGRTKAGKQKRWTIILGVIFAILTIATCIIIFIFSNQNGEKSGLTSRGFVRKIVEITGITNNLNETEKEELIEKLQELKLNKNDFYKIILNGKRNFEINILEINKLIQNNNILKLKDKTKINYELEKIKNENSLRGIYVDLILEKIKELNNEEEINKYLRAIEIGLDSLENT